jgi:hypothetical protein
MMLALVVVVKSIKLATGGNGMECWRLKIENCRGLTLLNLNNIKLIVVQFKQH